jgi:hypothetical protein
LDSINFTYSEKQKKLAQAKFLARSPNSRSHLSLSSALRKADRDLDDEIRDRVDSPLARAMSGVFLTAPPTEELKPETGSYGEVSIN